ncbi:hypothetical protein HYH03_011773 [Edaphochlamys debaryana]|uniref:Pyrrolo-quinoline quinone repeat domain-containing protein n=1 Tax=Edaphochlamys debaryana TaxID=47281 RepID=A0A835XT71_9CHLO|nr:hypothetical protein HYH03_011773 [Edaphochlamys debaryana]|eukprot:KAG2489661.1 hypothetical protein HYH03_011773 [Edaphochlamys debaryana]
MQSLVRFEVLEPLGAVLLATIPPASPPADVIKTRLWLVDFQGNTRWTADLGGTARSPRIISERLIPDLQRQAFYFVDSKGFLVAMAMATGLPGSDLCIHLDISSKEPPGDTVWRQWGGQGLVEPLNPVVADGRAFFGSAGQRVHAYDAKTGRVLWLFDSGAGAGTSAALWRTPGFGPQGAYAGGMLFYGGGDNAWWSLNATDGSPVWTYRLEDMDFTAASSVAVHDGILYATATPFYSTVKPRATRILALDARTGEEVWSRTMLGAVTETELGELLVEPELGAVVVGTDDGTLQAYSLGPDGGDLLWALRTSTASIWAALYHEGVVYAADMQGMVHAVRVSGDSQEVLWSADLRPVVARLVPIPVSTVTMFRPQTLYGKLYVPTNQGLAVMNASSGAVLWTDGMYNRIGRGLTLVEHPPDPADPYGKPVVQVLYAQYFNYLVSMTDACGVPWTGGDDTAPTSSPPPPPSAPPTPLVPPSCPPCPNNTACGGFEGTGGSITQPRLTQTLSLGLTGVPYSVVTSRGGRAAVLRSLREALGSSGAGGRAELVWRSAARADAPRDVYGGVVVKVELRAGSAGLLSDCQTSLEGAVLEGRLEEGLRRALRGLAQTAPVLAPAVRVRSLMALG